MAEIIFQWQIDNAPHEQTVADDAPATLGREAGCTVHVESPTVSRRHAQVRRRADGFAVSDLTNGRNPVIVNGQPIAAETPLAAGNSVTLGTVTLRVAAVRGIGPAAGGPTMRMRWNLGGQPHEETVVGGDPVTIGRDAGCEIVIPSPTISRQHVRIQEKGGRFVVADLTAGRNPVSVNQRPLSGERFLSPGDVVRLGDVTIVVTAMQGARKQQTGVTELHGRLVVCPTCHREVEGSYQDCPWCGTALVNAETVIPGI